MPDLDDLRLVLAAAEHQALGVVARSHHVSQSTVTRAVQRVETSIGRPLFDRIGKSVRLRDGAADDVEAIRSIVERWTVLVSPAVASPTPLSLFCTVTASQAVVPAMLASFRRSHPDVVLHLQTGPASAAIEAVRTSSVDVAVAALPSRAPAGLVMKRLTSTPLVAVAAPDVRSWSVLVLPRTGVTRDLVDGWRRHALPGDVTVQGTDSHEEVVALAALGSGVGIVPRLVVEASALRPQLRELTPRRRLPTMELGLVARRSAIAAAPLSALWAMAE